MIVNHEKCNCFLIVLWLRFVNHNLKIKLYKLINYNKKRSYPC
ncbi:hypothetical protein SEHO0A_03309 [Salmonella enterica subsp. houtenae str. ATCC BAA-1581]|nr:hypothetical protein SEHO0A_03309 [Salmonella enterica subsp. houtenae str. ATCC BAA-1581]ENZ85368.1 hypothetical protein D088_740068 [Salmonella enterica subsp. houtenae serovar 16:z4,z32:-- str. RKS3027]